MSDKGVQAETSLRELDALRDQTRLASRSMATGFPLIGWGTAYPLGLGALDLLDGLWRITIVALAWLIGTLLSWLPVRKVIRTGSETQIRWAWLAVFFASPLMAYTSQPASFAHSLLVVGSLWGLAMCLYAIATGDWAFAVAAGCGVVAAAVLASPGVTHRPLWFGVLAGLPLLALGINRVLRGVNRV